jgi:hypothetical protein
MCGLKLVPSKSSEYFNNPPDELKSWSERFPNFRAATSELGMGIVAAKAPGF